MPIIIKNDLPVQEQLDKDNIFYMKQARADAQDIRPLEVLILNLMPDKQSTELDLYRQLSNTPLQLNITLMRTETYESTHTEKSYLDKYYTTFSQIKDKKFDGLIVTGAPLEHLEYEEVDYWNEFCHILDWAKDNVTSTLLICWAALAGMYYHYDVPKITYPHKLTGLFKHIKVAQKDPLMRGFDDYYYAPHSRWVGLRDIPCEVDVLSWLEDYSQPGIAKSKDNKFIYSFGHLEYERNTLDNECKRDLAKNIKAFPIHYYKETLEGLKPELTWRMASTLFYTNWINYYVYQASPYILK